ncbi:MAG: AMP-binding enzyme, partial [Thermoplasmatota archaeon]
VIGVPDKVYQEVGWAFVMAVPGQEVAGEELRELCKSKLANFKVPKYIWFVDDYPMTQSGKIQKFKLKEMAVEKFGLKS